MPIDKSTAVERFQTVFSAPPQWVVRAPGRVNLIGEHTDYNDGFVMPLAIDRAVWIALRPRDDGRVVAHSVDYDQTAEFSLDALQNGQTGWLEYIKGTAWSLQEEGFRLNGWEGVVLGDVPAGAGLSSSAALEMATARAFAQVSGLVWDPARMAILGQRAENRWVGVNCGIMDQLISAVGQKDHAVLIDCRSLALQQVPLPPGLSVVVLDTATRRGLVDSAYNERRANCEASARYFAVAALRDVDMTTFEQLANGLDPVAERRARHVISENERTQRAAEAMQRGDAETLGRLMIESHVSLRDDYEVSSEALNAMVDAALMHPACFGARMTGAGFGGCAVAIVRSEAADDFARQTADVYQNQTGQTPSVYVCRATAGAAVID
jgi:galactokinase